MTIQKADANDHNRIVNQNASVRQQQSAKLKQGKAGKNGQIRNGSININELNGKMDAILMRRQRAQKKAMKVISDAWAADRKIDMDLENRGNRIQELKDNIDENMKMLDNCNARMEELKAAYGIEEGSQEQKDIELAALWNRNSAAARISKEFGSKETWEELTNISLSDDDWQRMTALEGKLPDTASEYQRRALAVAQEMGVFQKNIDDAQEEINIEYGAIRAIKQERLKDHGMVDAQKEADQINADASKAIIGMLVGEAQEHVDETIKEKIEDAKEKAKEKEEQEEKLEEQRLEKEEQRAQLELQQEESRVAEEIKAEQRQKAREQADILEEAGEKMSLPSANAAEAQAQIREMLQRMKLLEEDLKGAKIDAMADN